jgi:hypothetical protein
MIGTIEPISLLQWLTTAQERSQCCAAGLTKPALLRRLDPRSQLLGLQGRASTRLICAVVLSTKIAECFALLQ